MTGAVMPEPFPNANLESRCFQIHPVQERQTPGQGMQGLVSACLP